MDTSKRIFALVLFLLFLSGGHAQNKYFIEFKDKAGSPFSTSRAGEFLTQKSLDRRSMYNIPLMYTDLPVTPSYISQVDAKPGTIVWYVSKWMNGVVVSFEAQTNEAAALADIQTLPFVKSQSKVRRYRSIQEPIGDGTGNRFKSTISDVFNYGGSHEQAAQLNIPCLHEKGYRGQGMVIAVLDAGFNTADHCDVFDSLRASGRLAGTRDFVFGGTGVYDRSNHGTNVLSCMAAIKPGVAIGTAPLATYWLLRTEDGDSETLSEEYNWIRGAEFADSVGCDILTTSLGYTHFDDSLQNHHRDMMNGRTAPMSRAATIAARTGMFVLNAAGNEAKSDWHYIGVPGDADSICTVGSVGIDKKRSDFSSVGPTVDGRIKPDLVARGGDCWVCGGDPSLCFSGSGTSFATPVLAGAVACYWQANRKIDNIRLLNRLKNNASNEHSPNNDIGWGLPNVCAAVNGSFDFTAYSKPAGLVVQVEDADYDYLNIEVFDILGKKICGMETKGTELKLGFITPDLSAGVYVITVDTSSGKKSKKVLRLDL